MANKKLLLILFSLITLSSYSQENDDVYWTMYDADTVEQETTTHITNNYYNYTSRINRFYRRPFYASYWSYHNPYWYSYHCYPFYVGYYWGYNPYIYYGWHSPHNYSYWYSNRPTYYYAHYDQNVYYSNYRKANNEKKTVAKTSYKPSKTKPTAVRYKPSPTLKHTPKHSSYSRPKSVRYNNPKQIQPRPKSTSPSTPKYTRPKSIQRPTKVTSTQPKVNYSRSSGVKRPR